MNPSLSPNNSSHCTWFLLTNTVLSTLVFKSAPESKVIFSLTPSLLSMNQLLEKKKVIKVVLKQPFSDCIFSSVMNRAGQMLKLQLCVRDRKENSFQGRRSRQQAASWTGWTYLSAYWRLQTSRSKKWRRRSKSAFQSCGSFFASWWAQPSSQHRRAPSPHLSSG